MKHDLSEKWIKAAIAGTIWAASEIVLGSFLHNLRIPFSGNILTAIGIITLISISYIWTDKGLFWRAGLICAIMKTMSPSAVIFGPMIAILAESFILEFFTRILGRTYPGYISGAMVAMSWNLFHKIISYIVNYGSDIIEVYSRLLSMAQRQLDIQTDIVWLPIIILLIVYTLFGLFAGIIGIMVGRKMLKQPAPIPSDKTINKAESINIPKKQFNYSLWWLMADLILIIGTFVTQNIAPWYVWITLVTAIIILWAFRYRNSLRRISKPGFWIFFVVITLLTAFVFSRTQTGEPDFGNGLITGIQMNFRAALIIVGFSVLGTELYNPRIREFFSRTSFRYLPAALEIAVESLPDFIAGIPEFRILVKNPVSVFYNVISQAGNKLSELKNRRKIKQIVFIISGGKESGKTTFTRKVVEEIKKYNIPLGGFLAERVMAGNTTTGYDIVDIRSERKEAFLRKNEEKWKEKIGKFHISPEGLKSGISILDPSRQQGIKIVVIDEVGLLETEGKGWAGRMEDLIHHSENHLLITVRDCYIDNVLSRWDLADNVIFKVSEHDPVEVARIIIDRISV